MDAISDALTFHAFEIESAESEILDVKVTPNRGHDCLSHRGIAKELSAILNLPLKNDPLAARPRLAATDGVAVSINTPLCSRYIAGYIRGVKVGPSPEWLRQALESLGQRSINNIVDATNYVMFNIGQPLHAFDAGKLTAKAGKYAIAVRLAHPGETMLALDDKEYKLLETMLVIADQHSDTAIGIAGVKGGKPSGVDESTTDIILESAQFDGVSVRRTAAALKLRTDASERFQQVISPELALYGAAAAADLICKIAGGEVEGFTDVYPAPLAQRSVSISVESINKILGTELTGAEVADVFIRLGFGYKEEGGIFEVMPPPERLDILIPEDLAEEVGRVVGYDKVVPVELPKFEKDPEVNAIFYAAEKMRETLISQGYSEVFTSVFADEGERAVANKVDSVRPYLRTSLIDGLNEAHAKNARNKDLLGLKEVKLFEIGSVWKGGKETMMVGTVTDKEKASEKPLASVPATKYDDLPLSTTERYKPFSRFPSITRDIALWVSSGTTMENVMAVIAKALGDFAVRIDLFDEFKKGDKISYAFRTVFQSPEKTLTNDEANAAMEKVYTVVAKNGWQVR